jgi:hypothetical protein
MEPLKTFTCRQRFADWPDNFFSTVTYRFEEEANKYMSETFVAGCRVKIEGQNLPLDNKNSQAIEKKLLWKKLAGTEVENYAMYHFFQAPAKRIYEGNIH